MKKPLVSIIIPCYNVEFLIFRLLDSILLQNYSNVEVIAIDDGSTDHTSQVLQSYVDKFKDKKYDFHIYEQINQGLSTTINNGLKYVNAFSAVSKRERSSSARLRLMTPSSARPTHFSSTGFST